MASVVNFNRPVRIDANNVTRTSKCGHYTIASHTQRWRGETSTEYTVEFDGVDLSTLITYFGADLITLAGIRTAVNTHAAATRTATA